MKLTEEIVQSTKAKFGDVLQVELPELDFVALVSPFTVTTCHRYVDEGIVSVDDASDRLLVRHVLWPPPSDVNTAKRRSAQLGRRIGDVLCEDAGLPITSPAKSSSDRLTSSTAPGVLAQAGLPEGKAAELLAAHPDVRLQLIVVSDSNGDVIFAGVLCSPGDVEIGLLRDAQERKRGYAQACLSAVSACLVWSRDDSVQTFERYPAIPTMVLPAELREMGGAATAKRFRRR